MIKNKRVIIVISLLILCITLVIFKGNVLNLKSNEVINTGLKSRKEKLKKFSYKEFFTVGWIQVQGTHIDYPIFTSAVPELEYAGKLNIDFSYTWRSIHYKNGENRLTIFGHNILNVSSKPLIDVDFLTDFEELMSFVYIDFAKENLYIQYTDEDGNDNLYAIYAISFIDEDVGYSIKDKKEIKKYINEAKKNSIYDYDINVNENDDIISLITCTRFFGKDNSSKFKIDAKKIQSDKKTYNYKVKENKNYDKILKKIKEEDKKNI